MKRILIVPLVCLLAACSTATPTAINAPSTENIDTEEVIVYAALLQVMYPGQNIVLEDHTSTSPSSVENTQDTLAFVLGEMTGVHPDTAASFQVRNDAPHPLKENMQLGLQYTLLDEENMRAIFNINQDGWSMFYSRYPNSPGITSLSRVGFNMDMDQALIYIGNQSHWLGGAGYYILMEKESGIWLVDQQVMTWIS